MMLDTTENTNLIAHDGDIIKQIRYNGRLVDALYILDEHKQIKKVWNPVAVEVLNYILAEDNDTIVTEYDNLPLILERSISN